MGEPTIILPTSGIKLATLEMVKKLVTLCTSYSFLDMFLTFRVCKSVLDPQRLAYCQWIKKGTRVPEQSGCSEDN